MVPEKSAEILARADDPAHNRLVCGVHTASDLEASRRVAYAMFGSMLEEPRFQQDLAERKRSNQRKGSSIRRSLFVLSRERVGRTVHLEFHTMKLE
jgi:hypothetical protein